MSDLVFFYGTLMRGFERPGRAGVDDKLRLMGRGWISAALFDLGLYPAAIPAEDSRVWGEVHQMREPDAVLPALDEIEGYSASEPVTSLYTRDETPVTLSDGTVVLAWVYFYNAPLGKADRIASGDYLAHLKVRRHA
ncbi:MAG: gamma-glutamylcyclotransferase [Vicinamibacterales bacterium]